MFTFKRLDETLTKSLTLPLNDGSRYVIMSDMHRADHSASDEFAPNKNIFLHAINHYYKNNFHVIENGDGDELWEHRHFRHIYFAHQDVFNVYQDLYHDDRLTIIYGNHNMQLRNPQKVKDILWKVRDPYTDEDKDFLYGIKTYEGVRLHYEEMGKDLFITHGHQGDLLSDHLWPLAQFLSRFVWRYFHLVGFRNPSSPAKSHSKRNHIEKNYKKWITENQQLLIVGHTHRAKFSLPEDNLPYFNTGSCVRPAVINAIEIVGGCISLVDWKTWPNDKGLLQIKRRVLEGPVALSRYFKVS